MNIKKVVFIAVLAIIAFVMYNKLATKAENTASNDKVQTEIKTKKWETLIVPKSTKTPDTSTAKAIDELPKIDEPWEIPLNDKESILLDREKLKIDKINDDGTVIYRYDNSMTVTILFDGKVLLTPDEI